MQYLCLNPRALTTPEKAHDYVAHELDLPEGYGRTPDALCDALTARHAPLSVLCLRYELGGAAAYPHLEPLYRAIEQAAQSNQRLRVDVQTLPATGINPIFFGPP